MAACYHRACGRRFGGLRAFDAHLVWSRQPPFVSCVDPALQGLAQNAAGVWGTPYAADRPKSAERATPTGD